MLAGLAGLVHDRQRDENSHDDDNDQGALHRDLALPSHSLAEFSWFKNEPRVNVWRHASLLETASARVELIAGLTKGAAGLMAGAARFTFGLAHRLAAQLRDVLVGEV
jgi:hypothetical protein